MHKWSTDQRRIISEVDVVVQNWRERGRDPFDSGYQGVLLCGAVGAGKTLIARTLFAGCSWFDAPDIGKEATSGMNRGHEGRSAYDMIRDAGRSSVVVVVDELGRERETDHYGRDILWSIINTALNRRNLLVLISNRTREGLVAHYGGDEGWDSRLAMLKTITFPPDMPDFRKARR